MMYNSRFILKRTLIAAAALVGWMFFGNAVAQTVTTTVRPKTAVLSPAVKAPQTITAVSALKADEDRKLAKYSKPTTNHVFTFGLTNIAATPITITEVTTSCGCTVAELPSKPWTLESLDSGNLVVTLDLRGKYGTLTKSVLIHSSAGYKTLQVSAELPPRPAPGPSMGNRAKNIQAALSDRTAIFKGECVKCHVKPGEDRMGKPLYAASCGICHDAVHRASMVPDLRKLTHPTNREHWDKWVREGKEGTLMPGFAKEHGGPLTEEQIVSLVDFLTKEMPAKAFKAPPGI